MAKPKTTKLPIPVNDTQVNEYITAVAEATTEANKLVDRANQRLTAIKAELAAALAPLEEEIAQHSVALFTFFEKHKEVLTEGGRRQSIAYATGLLGQRWTPPRTKIKKEQSVIDYVVAHKLSEFFETKTVLRRDAMLANRRLAETIPGVTFVRDRIVYAKPDSFDDVINLNSKLEAA